MSNLFRRTPATVQGFASEAPIKETKKLDDDRRPQAPREKACYFSFRMLGEPSRASASSSFQPEATKGGPVVRLRETEQATENPIAIVLSEMEEKAAVSQETLLRARSR